jgi:hypothetical protein
VSLPPSTAVYDGPVVRLTSPPGSLSSRILRRASSSGCSDGDWYAVGADSSWFSTEIGLCPDACSAFAGDPGAAIEADYACLVRS